MEFDEIQFDRLSRSKLVAYAKKFPNTVIQSLFFPMLEGQIANPAIIPCQKLHKTVKKAALFCCTRNHNRPVSNTFRTLALKQPGWGAVGRRFRYASQNPTGHTFEAIGSPQYQKVADTAATSLFAGSYKT